MKKTLTRAGAIGLAAATILTGLSFGSAAASAAPSDPSALSAEVIRTFTSPVGWELADGDTAGIYNVNGVSYAKRFADRAQFLAASHQVKVTQYDDRTFTMEDMQAAGTQTPTLCTSWGSLLGADGLAGFWGSCTGTQAKERWIANSDGSISPVLAPTRSLTNAVVNPDRQVWMIAGAPGAPGAKLVGDDNVASMFFGATVSDISIPERSAVLTGTAVPGSTVIINDDQSADVDDDGTWSATVSGLHLGVNTMVLEQYEGPEKTADARVEIDLAVQPVDATVTFDTDVTKKATLSGTAHPGADIVVEDAAGVEIDRAPASPVDGTWELEIPAPNLGGDYPITVHQLIDGEPNGEIERTIAYGEAVTITRPVPDAAHAGGPLTMRGTGEAGAAVTVREVGSADVIGSKKVMPNRVWSLDTTNLDDRKHVLEVTQTGKGGNVTTSTITINPEADTVRPLTVETPENGSTVTTSRPVFTGHGQDGATVTIGYGATAIGTTTVVDGDWTITPTRGLGMGVSDLTVTQDAGGEVSTLTHTLTRVAAELPLAVTSHVDGQTYAEGVTTFRGTAPVGSAVRATNQWDTVMGTATATDGTWSFNRNLGPTTAGYDLTFTATPPVGTPQTVSLKLLYAGNLAFQVTSPVNNSTYTVGTTTFTGTAAPGTTVTATNQWGTSMGRASTALGTTWAFDRYLGPTSAGYDIAFVATKGTDTQRTALHLATAVVNVPVDVTSITDGATYRPGLNVLTGTGTPGATVEAVNATNGWNVPMGKATVKADGTWALPERNWGPSNDYAIQVTQTNPDKTTSTTTVTVKAPVFAPLVLTRPAVGDTYDTGVAARFEGTATPFAEITVRSAKSSAVYRTVEADADGNWSFTRVWGPTHDYVLDIDQKATNGQADSITGFDWNHSGN